MRLQEKNLRNITYVPGLTLASYCYIILSVFVACFQLLTSRGTPRIQSNTKLLPTATNGTIDSATLLY